MVPVEWLSRLGAGLGGPFGVDMVAGQIRFLVWGGRPLVVGGVVGWSARWVVLPSNALMLLVHGGLRPGGEGWWAVVVVVVVVVMVGQGLTATAIDGSHVPGSVWPAAVVVCGGWMRERLEMGMLTRVWTGLCWVAASVVAALAAGGGGAGCGGCGLLAWVWFRVRVGAGLLLLTSYFMWFLRLCGLVLGMLLLLVVVLVLLRAVLLFGFRFWFGVRFWVGVPSEVVEDLVPEVRGHRCWVAGGSGRAARVPGLPLWGSGGLRQLGVQLLLWLWSWHCG